MVIFSSLDKKQNTFFFSYSLFIYLIGIIISFPRIKEFTVDTTTLILINNTRPTLKHQHSATNLSASRNALSSLSSKGSDGQTDGLTDDLQLVDSARRLHGSYGIGAHDDSRVTRSTRAGKKHLLPMHVNGPNRHVLDHPRIGVLRYIRAGAGNGRKVSLVYRDHKFW